MPFLSAKSSTLLLWFSIVLLFSGRGLAQEFYIKNFGIQDGVSCLEVHDVIQAHDRYLWLATCNSLMRFDGVNFEKISLSPAVTPELIRLFEDSKYRIWAGARNLPVQLMPDGFPPHTDSALLNQTVNAKAFAETPDGTVWIFVPNAIFTYRNDTLRKVYSGSGPDYTEPNSAMVGPDGKIWVTMLGSGVVLIDPDDLSMMTYNQWNGKINNICYSVYRDASDNMWVGSYGVLYRFDRKGNISEYPMGGKGSRNRIWAIDSHGDGKLFLALYGSGMGIFDTLTGAVQKVGVDNGLKDNYSFKLLVDVEGNIWIASQGGGLDRFTGTAFETFNIHSGLPGNAINHIAVSPLANEVYVATKGGLARIDANGEVSVVIADRYINDVAIDSMGNVWYAASKRYGVLGKPPKVNPKQDLFYCIATGVEGCDAVFAGEMHIAEVNDGNVEIWPVPGLHARQMVVCGGKVFILTLDGLVQWDGHKAKPVAVATGEYDNILAVSDTQLILTRSNLVLLLSLSDNTIDTALRVIGSLGKEDHIRAVYAGDTAFWVATNSRLLRAGKQAFLSGDSVEFKEFSRYHEVVEGEVDKGSLTMDHSGELYIGTTEGLMKINLPEYREYRIPPLLNLRVKEIISGRSFNADTLSPPVRFPFDENRLTLRMGALSLTMPQNIRYKYRLIGFDSVWSEPTSTPQVTFSFLPPGNYVYEFVADNGSGVWAGKPFRFAFTILPPFWETGWFRFLVALLFFGIVAMLVYYRERKAFLLEKEQQRFTQAIWQAHEDERKRISKELHDDLGQNMLVIKNFVEGSDGYPRIRKVIESSIATVRSLTRILHPFALEKFGLTVAIQSLADDMNTMQDRIFFSAEVDDVSGIFSPEAELNIYRIVQEAISNIIKHSGATAAKIEVKKQVDEVTVVVRDNGKGFEVAAGSNKLKSFGLKSIRERAKIINGKVLFRSTPGSGTILEIKIQLQ